MNPVNDIMYPECHLDSPIVAGKLIEMIMYASLPSNQPLEDETLIRNIRTNIARRLLSPTIIAQQQFYKQLLESGLDVNKFVHIPYPNGNKTLFHISDSTISSKLYNLIKISHSSYSKISQRLVDLKHQVEQKLGLNGLNNRTLNYDKLNENSILQLHLKFEGSKWFKPFLFWFAIKTDLRELIKNSPKGNTNQKYDNLVYDVKDYYIQMNRNLLLILEKKNFNVHYLTVEMVLMMADVTEGRLMIDTALECDIRYNEFKNHGKLLWTTIDSLFCDLGNQTYNIVALIEPLTLGYLQLNDKSPIIKGAFLKYVLGELVDELESCGFNNEDDLYEIVRSFNKIFTIKDIHMTAEFFSFFRTFAHPILEASNAAKKVREHMNKSKVISFQTLMKGHALFCGIIINGFRDRHGGSWPPFELPAHASKKITNIYHNNERLTDEDCITEWKSFVGAKFGCFMPLILDDDLTMYMKDKALAAIKSEWDSVYPKESMIYTPPPQTQPRRLVEVFLNDSEFDPVNLIKYVTSGEYLNDPEFNLSYSLKEKEIKQVARLFAKMTYKMRACQVLAESLIANGVGKYFKENGMAKDEHDLLKSLHQLSVSSVPRDNKTGKMADINKHQDQHNVHQTFKHRRTLSGDNKHESHKRDSNEFNRRTGRKVNIGPDKPEAIQYEVISTFLTADLQKFCLNWRQETSNIFAQRLNEIYGLPNFFNWMHKRLEKSTLYVSDPYCPPYNSEHINLDEVENRQIFIKYPMGGIEGYCQKLWTIVTIPFLFLSAYEVGARIAAVVQGDNQAIAITTRVHPNLPYTVKKNRSAQLAQRYFNQLRLNMGDIGHNLKANETIVSTHFFVYSKRIYYDGQVLSQALKPMSRVVFWSETIVDETRSACSNISTAISKSIEQGFSRWVGYSLNILKTLQQLIISLRYSINPNMTSDITDPLIRNQNWLIAAALIPSQLGGFNYMNISRLYVRNIGDPATASIADIKRLIRSRLLHENILQKIMFQDPGDSTYLDWASDPYSINTPESQSVTVMIKNVTARSILQNSENPMLRGLFHFDFEQEDQDLARFLMDRQIIIPRAAHEIMDHSLTGARQEIAGMLDTTKGLIRNSIRMGGIRPRLIDRLVMYDYNQFRIFNNLMRVQKTSDLIDPEACSVHLAINLRRRMWSHLSHGRIIYGLEVPDVIEVVNGYYINDCEDCYHCSSGNQEFCWFFVPKNCELDKVNKETNAIRVPYFGSTTEERSEIKLSSVRSPSKALRAAIRIATVYSWAYGDTEEAWEEAWYLASFRANVTIDELKAITPISTSNNMAHRLRDKSTQVKYSGNTLNRVSRYTVMSNDNLNFVVDGMKIDTNLVYQQIMLIGLASMEDKFRYLDNTGENNTLFHLHISTNCCIIEMNDHPYVASQNVLPVLQKVDCNKLIYDDDPILDSEQIKIHQQLYRSANLNFPTWDIQQLNVALAQSLSLTIIEIITKENRDHLNEFKVFSNDDNINSLITEFLLIEPNMFSLYMGLAISINWAFDIYYRRPQGKYQMSEFLHTILITTNRSNLNVLANAFSHPKVFNRFWNAGLIEPIYGPNLSQQDFTSLVIDFLVESYINYINYWLNDNTCEYMITESTESIVDQRFEIAQARHLCFLSCLYLSRTDMPIIRGLTSIEKCTRLSDKLEEVRNRELRYLEWNTEILPVSVYPSSLTYIRRGSIKHIRLRESLTSDAIGFNRLLFDNAQPRLFELHRSIVNQVENYSYYFPATSVFSDDFVELNYPSDWFENMNRWESHVFRRIGINSTSCYKAVEIYKYLQTIKESYEDKLMLGEGSGSMMAVYYLSTEKGKLYYNTGVSEMNTIGQRVLSVYPSEYFLVAKNNPSTTRMIEDLNVLFNGKPESTWIGNNSAFQYIMNSIKTHSLDLVHSDMESSATKDNETILIEQIHVLALAINLSKEDGVLVTKLAPQFNDSTREIIYLHKMFYSECFIFIPYTSNPYSSEFYLISYQMKNVQIVTPAILYSYYKNINLDQNTSIQDIIQNLKVKRSEELRQAKRYHGTYTNSDLYSLTGIEKHLMSMGFKVNGPKIIKSYLGHDVSTGEANLISSINIQLNHILNINDPNRETIPFFDPYPILDSSKLREGMLTLAKRVICFFILYGFDKYSDSRSFCIRNLRRKIIVLDMVSDSVKSIIQPYLIKRYKNLKIKYFWSFKLSTQEIKYWWKIVGYSMLLADQGK